MPRSPGQLRVVAVALALLWGLAPLVSALHSDEHAHRYCLEHRAFEEGGGAVGSGLQAFSPDEAHVFARAEASSPDDHVACALAPPGSRFTSSEPARSPLQLGTRDDGAPAQHDLGGHPPIAWLDLAPKSSPPFAPAV